MHPRFIIIVVEYNHRDNIICATFANSQEEAQSIAQNWNDGYHYVNIVPCDYSMRGE